MSGTPLNIRPVVVPGIIAALFLFGAQGSWPYGYFVLLRWIVCTAGAYAAYQAHLQRRQWAVWLFSFISLLFNPIVPVYLSREIWQPIDFLTALCFLTGVIGLVKQR